MRSFPLRRLLRMVSPLFPEFASLCMFRFQVFFEPLTGLLLIRPSRPCFIPGTPLGFALQSLFLFCRISNPFRVPMPLLSLHHQPLFHHGVAVSVQAPQPSANGRVFDGARLQRFIPRHPAGALRSAVIPTAAPLTLLSFCLPRVLPSIQLSYRLPNKIPS
jgi:hypothetical protein